MKKESIVFDTEVIVNKYPYWLFSRYKIKVNMDKEKNILKSKYKESHYTKVPPYQIFIIKYVPFLLLFLFYFNLPTTMDELVLSLVVILWITITYLLSKSSTFLLKLMLFITLVIFYIAIFNFDVSGRTINTLISWFLKIYMILFIFYDFIKYGYKNYYYLEDAIESGKVTISKFKKRSAMRVPFTKKHLLNIPTGFNAQFNYSFGGYYFKISEKKETHEVH